MSSGDFGNLRLEKLFGGSTDLYIHTQRLS